MDPVKAASVQERAEMVMEMVGKLVEDLLDAEGPEFSAIAKVLADEPTLAEVAIKEMAVRLLEAESTWLG